MLFMVHYNSPTFSEETSIPFYSLDTALFLIHTYEHYGIEAYVEDLQTGIIYYNMLYSENV